MRLLAYVRVSSAKQALHGHSLDDQPDRLEAYCKAYGYTLVGTVAEEVSARKVPLERRTGGAELLRRLAAGEADGVIVTKLDRLFRDMRDGLTFFGDALYGRRRQRAAGLQVVSLAEHVDTSTAAGRAMLKYYLLEADNEADRISERTAHAMEGLRKRGRVFGRIPYGCIAQGGMHAVQLGRMVDQQLFREPTTWAHRVRIVSMVREQGMSLSAVSDALLAAGITPPGGGCRWQKSSLSQLVERHDSLVHLPLWEGPQCADAATKASDTPVSPAGEGA